MRIILTILSSIIIAILILPIILCYLLTKRTTFKDIIEFYKWLVLDE